MLSIKGIIFLVLAIFTCHLNAQVTQSVDNYESNGKSLSDLGAPIYYFDIDPDSIQYTKNNVEIPTGEVKVSYYGSHLLRFSSVAKKIDLVEVFHVNGEKVKEMKFDAQSVVDLSITGIPYGLYNFQIKGKDLDEARAFLVK